jgi:hypothetical protein
MTPLTELAAQCGATAADRTEDGHWWHAACAPITFTPAQLTAFAERIREDEREKCAKVAESAAKGTGPDGEPNCVWEAAYRHVCEEIAVAIREERK